MGMQRVMRQRANQIHVSAYEQYTSSALDARPYSLTNPGAPKIPTWTSREGGNLGGPLIIPHVYNGADRTYFFLNFEGQWARTGVNQFSTVPTLFERQNPGNFCDRPNTQLYVPTNAANPFGGQTFVGCQIPSGMLNPSALALLQYIPLPNVPGAGFAQNYNLLTEIPSETNRLNTRIMQTISPKLNARVIYAFSQSDGHALQNFPDFETDQSTRGQSATVGLTQNYTRNWINDTQLIFSRNRAQTLSTFANTNDAAAAAGITGVSTAPIDWGVPQLNFTNFTGIGSANPSLTRNQTWRFVDGLTNTRARHTIQLGAEVRRIDNNTFSDPTPEGQFTFNGLYTGASGPGGQVVPGTGLDFADFLLGDPFSTTVQYGTPSIYLRNWGFVGYGQDDWRVSPSFTMQYGVRFEAFTPISELYGHLANLDLQAGEPAAVVVPGGSTPYSGSLPPALIRGDYTGHWTPRLGLAWRPPIKALQGAHSTTVRAGYGMFYNESIYNQLATRLANQPPWADSALYTASSSQLLSLQDGFPSSGISQDTATNTYAVNPNYKIGYIQTWDLSIETALSPNWSLVETYQGSRGTDLDMLEALNRPAPGSSSTLGPIADAGNFIYDTSGANSVYNALQSRLQKRMSRGLGFSLVYTYARAEDDASSIGGVGGGVVVQNPADLQSEWGLSSFDVRNRLQATYSYALPLGDRQRYAQQGWKYDVLGNWRVSGTVTAQSGSPYTILAPANSANNSGGAAFQTRADVLTGCDPILPAADRTPTEFFNTACFVVPPADQYGDVGRNAIIGPGQYTWNANFQKEITFGRDRNRRIDINWSINNVLNHVNLAGLSTTVDSATFGRVTGAGAMRSMTLLTRVNF